MFATPSDTADRASASVGHGVSQGVKALDTSVCVPCQGPTHQHEDNPWREPLQACSVDAEGQVSAMVTELQWRGLTGVISRSKIIGLYAELCWQEGFHPLGGDTFWYQWGHLMHLGSDYWGGLPGMLEFFKELGRHCQRVRPVVDGKRITAYVIPDPRVPNAKQNAASAGKIVEFASQRTRPRVRHYLSEGPLGRRSPKAGVLSRQDHNNKSGESGSYRNGKQMEAAA